MRAGPFRAETEWPLLSCCCVPPGRGPSPPGRHLLDRRFHESVRPQRLSPVRPSSSASVARTGCTRPLGTLGTAGGGGITASATSGGATAGITSSSSRTPVATPSGPRDASLEGSARATGRRSTPSGGAGRALAGEAFLGPTAPHASSTSRPSPAATNGYAPATRVAVDAGSS